MITVCIPTYNNQDTISKTLYSIYLQRGCNFEILVSDNKSTDDTMTILKQHKERNKATSPAPLRIITNYKQGCGNNLNNLIKEAKTDILYFMCADDVMRDELALNQVEDIFKKQPCVGIITRYYYWFIDNPRKPVRVRVLNAHPTDFEIFQSFDQISGIAIRKELIKKECSNDPFIEIASILFPVWEENIKIIMAKKYPVAIRISHSMSPKTFEKSPIMSWYSLVKDYPDLVDYIAKNYVGLIQIKNFGTWKQLFREIKYMVKLRRKNLFNPVFLFFVLGTILTPRWMIRKMIYIYRRIPK